MACTMQYDPVCGVKDGTHQTFGNACVAGSEGAIVQHRGECSADELAGRGSGKYVPPESCTAWFDGCNSCGRGEDGQSFCTLRACLGEPAAGYCTAYETDPKPAPVPNPGTANDRDLSMSSDVSANPEPGSSADANPAEEGDSHQARPTPEQKSFLLRMWESIAGWFGSIF